MNSLYNLALRQSSSLQADLARLDADPAGSASTALQGQLTTTFSAFTKTVEDYEGMARKELVMSKQEKALERVKKFREEEKELKTQFERLKNRAKVRSDWWIELIRLRAACSTCWISSWVP